MENQGFEVRTAEDGHWGLHMFHREKPDLVLLDVLLPGMTGMELCQEIRKSSNTPIIFLSCKRESGDMIQGLDLGADDYMTKPFDPAVLAARVKANLRRAAIDPKMSKCGCLTIDWPGREILRDGERIPLLTKERQLLFFLLEHPNQVFSISQIYAQVWGFENSSDEQTIKVHISHLRKKIEDDPADPKLIQTVRGFGYKFNSL